MINPLDWISAPFVKPCPVCGGPTTKALYLGAPLRLCEDGACCCAWGLGADLAVLMQVNDGGWYFAAYEGPYPVALFHWLRGAYADGAEAD